MNAETFLNDIPRETAQAAYSGISFTPDKRADQEREGYAQLLAQDYGNLLRYTEGKPGAVETLNAEFARYRDGYRVRLLKKLQSDSRCMSSMIAGPANFPVRRNEKRNRVAHKRLEELIEFRERALAAIRKTLCPELRPVMAGDGDACERLRAKIAEAEKLQEQMKAVNATHKAFLKNPASLDASPLSENLKARVREYKAEYSWEPHPIAPFELTNNGANIRRMKQRLESISRNQATEATEIDGETARFEDCPADNRVRLFFPGKPDADTRSRLKGSGFRWSPTIGAWQAYRNPRSIETAKQEAGITEL